MTTYTKSNAEKVYIFPLDSILQNNKTVIEKFSDSIKIRGYAYVKLSPEIVGQVDECVKNIEDFFKNEKEYKELYTKKPIFGYFDAKHKESFRLLTGKRLSEHKLPIKFEQINKMSNLSDKLMHRLCRMTTPYLFPDIDEKLKQIDIPLFRFNNYWGMFDITKYKNDGSKTGLNCNAHYDPGLLSIHYRSTQPGLQLKNEHGEWISPPKDNNVAIIWAGDVATKINPDIKHGMHRVANNGIGTPRIAIWYEICSAEQEHKELITTETKELAKIEHYSGIPISKSMAPSTSPSTSRSTSPFMLRSMSRSMSPSFGYTIDWN
jgi:isopenicillin N synthase-like dioxygenase